MEITGRVGPNIKYDKTDWNKYDSFMIDSDNLSVITKLRVGREINVWGLIEQRFLLQS